MKRCIGIAISRRELNSPSRPLTPTGAPSIMASGRTTYNTKNEHGPARNIVQDELIARRIPQTATPSAPAAGRPAHLDDWNVSVASGRTARDCRLRRQKSPRTSTSAATASSTPRSIAAAATYPTSCRACRWTASARPRSTKLHDAPANDLTWTRDHLGQVFPFCPFALNSSEPPSPPAVPGRGRPGTASRRSARALDPVCVPGSSPALPAPMLRPAPHGQLRARS